MKRDAGLQQIAVGLVELPMVIVWRVRTVDVVAEHDDELEREPLAPGDHLPRDLDLRIVAAPRIADRGEADRPGAKRHDDLPWLRREWSDIEARRARNDRLVAAATDQGDRGGGRCQRGADCSGAAHSHRARPPGIHPSATNCTATCPRLGVSSIRSSERSPA